MCLLVQLELMALAVISNIASLITKPIFMIYQQSVFNSVFPMTWKRTRITPIYKGKGSRDDPKSYQPVICDTLGKCLERIVNNQLMKHIEEHKFFCDAQYALRSSRSTVTNLLIADKYIAKWINNSVPFDIISFNLSKAFDRVPHKRIVPELHQVGLSDKIIT